MATKRAFPTSIFVTIDPDDGYIRAHAKAADALAAIDAESDKPETVAIYTFSHLAELTQRVEVKEAFKAKK